MKKSSINSKIEVSVIIVNYNTGHLLKECIRSVIQSTKNLKFPATEIIVIDNASTDNSLENIRGVSGIEKIIENNTNPGFSKANNQGISISRGKNILLLNPDTKIIGSAIKELVEFSKKYQDIGVVVPKLLNSDKSSQKSLMHFPTILRAISEFWFGTKNYSIYSSDSKTPHVVEAAVMAAFFITSKALELVGKLNEKYFMYFEDLDYCRSVCNKGLKIYYLPEAQIIHYLGVSGKSLANTESQWKRLIPSSKKYNGLLKHYLLTIIMWIGQKMFR